MFGKEDCPKCDRRSGSVRVEERSLDLKLISWTGH